MFSYQYGLHPEIDYPRLLISDTQAENHIFEDSEIQAATALQACQFQSGMFYSWPAGRNLPNTPVSYLRVAAILLDALAANKSRLSSVTALLDVQLAPDKAAVALRDQAKQYRELDDDAGAFVIIEQCNNFWSMRDRFWKQVQRQSGMGL